MDEDGRREPFQLVGRDQPLRQLVRALDDATAGHGPAGAGVGEPGVGKTSRWAVPWLRRAARRQGGYRCVLGRRGRSGSLALGASAAGTASSDRTDDWKRVAGPGREALDRLVDSDQHLAANAEFHVFDAVLQLLSALAATTPVALLVDDLQWATPRRCSCSSSCSGTPATSCPHRRDLSRR